MELLNSLKLAPYKSTNLNNSFLKRRRKLIAKIDEQILWATDFNYKLRKIKWVRNEDGTDRKLKIPKRVRRWWTEQLGGAILLTIRYGNKVIELEKGKNAIELSSLGFITGTNWSSFLNWTLPPGRNKTIPGKYAMDSTYDSVRGYSLTKLKKFFSIVFIRS